MVELRSHEPNVIRPVDVLQGEGLLNRRVFLEVCHVSLLAKQAEVRRNGGRFLRVELLFFFGNKIPRIKVLDNSLIIIGAVLLHDLFEGDPLKFQVHVGPLEALQAIRDLGLKLSHPGRLDIVETISILDEAPLCDGICEHF